ncbi:MAG: PTS sugar transporter subunit IIA [Dermabacter sp.]|nr:PTS sugar transporter subunit IIA [Dermabacter sp.]
MTSTPRIIVCQQRTFASKEELFDHVGTQLIADGIVRDTYITALNERESEYPTGLPIPGGVAIPHTSAEHVIDNALVLVRPEPPLTFNEMGGGENDTISASLVIFLVLSSADDHLATLQRLIGALQDSDVRAQLLSAHSPEDAHRALAPLTSSRHH